jgi:hypothetical protein
MAKKKATTKKSPTARTLEVYRRDGWFIDTVERFNPRTLNRHDFCGFADLIAYKGDETHAIQATSTPNMSARFKKIIASPQAAAWSDGKTRKLVIIGWRKYAKPEERRHWRETVQLVLPKDFSVPGGCREAG